MSEVRLRKVESLIQEQISALLAARVVKDPRVHELTAITGVRVSRDLRYAKVYVSFYATGEERERCVEALNHAAGFIRRALRERVRLRTVPNLTFLVDNSIERGFRVTQKIKEALS